MSLSLAVGFSPSRYSCRLGTPSLSVVGVRVARGRVAEVRDLEGVGHAVVVRIGGPTR
jgi:hypothetical protein